MRRKYGNEPVNPRSRNTGMTHSPKAAIILPLDSDILNDGIRLVRGRQALEKPRQREQRAFGESCPILGNYSV